MDITDGAGFDWRRWVANVEGARDLIRDGVHKVYAARWLLDDPPVAVFCHGNDSGSTLAPWLVRYTGAASRSRIQFDRDLAWRTHPLLSTAPVSSQSWLLLRKELIW